MERVVKAARSIIITLVPLALFVHAADPSTAGEALFEHLQHARVTFDDLTLSSRLPLTDTFGIETPVQSQHDP